VAWTWWGVPGFVAGSLAILLAFFLWRTARDETVRRRMTGLLLVESLVPLTGAYGPVMLVQDERAFAAIWTVHFLNDCLLLAIYLPAVATVVPSPLLGPFRKASGRVALASIAAFFAILFLVAPSSWVFGVGENFAGYGTPHAPVIGPAIHLLFVTLFCSYMLGLVVTVLQWRRTPGGVGRRQAGMLALAFGTRDLLVGAMYVSYPIAIALGFDFLDPSMETAAVGSLLIGCLGTALYVLLMSYAIAVINVIDIDLLIKQGLERSAVAAAFVAFFFVVSEATAAVLSDAVGTMAGIATTGALLFFLAPLQEFASKVADQAMPGVQDTAEYRQFRKLQIYGEAVREALASGPLDTVRRVALDGLRAELDLSENAALQMEARLAGDPAGT
jgi:hypothetical protein